MNRTVTVPGRILPVALLLLLVAGCSVAGGSPDPDPREPQPVRLSEDRPAARDEAEAARRYLEAREAFSAGAWSEAASIAAEVVAEHPGARVSGDALWLRVQALDRLGESAPAAEALAATDRLIAAFPPSDGRSGPARLARLRFLALTGEVEAAVIGALELPAGVRVEAEMRERVAEWTRTLDPLRLDVVTTTRASSVSPLRGTVFVEAGRALRLAGEDARAAELGAAAIRAGVEDERLDLARRLADGRPLPGARPERISIAAILPQSGSPSMRELASRVEEGIRAAIAAAGLEDLVDLEVFDDGGDPVAAASLVQAAEASGALAILGPLDGESLGRAAEARSEPVLLISPTAWEIPAGGEGVYSLASFDPGAVSALAAWAAAGGVGPLAVIHPADGPYAEEARTFVELYRAEGGEITGLFSFLPGTTFFEEQILGAVNSGPSGVVVAAPPEDLVALAPQVTFFGLDTLGIRVLGTAGWTDRLVTEQISTRHLDGVVASMPVESGPGGEGWERFRRAWEARFQRTLRDGDVPALGFDAAALVLGAVQAGARTPAEVRRVLGSLEPYTGATGELTVRGGRVARQHTVVCFDGTRTLEIPPGTLPELQYRPYSPDPAADPTPGGPGRKAGFLCPQVAPADPDAH